MSFYEKGDIVILPSLNTHAPPHSSAFELVNCFQETPFYEHWVGSFITLPAAPFIARIGFPTDAD